MKNDVDQEYYAICRNVFVLNYNIRQGLKNVMHRNICNIISDYCADRDNIGPLIEPVYTADIRLSERSIVSNYSRMYNSLESCIKCNKFKNIYKYNHEEYFVFVISFSENYSSENYVVAYDRDNLYTIGISLHTCKNEECQLCESNDRYGLKYIDDFVAECALKNIIINVVDDDYLANNTCLFDKYNYHHGAHKDKSNIKKMTLFRHRFDNHKQLHKEFKKHFGRTPKCSQCKKILYKKCAVCLTSLNASYMCINDKYLFCNNNFNPCIYNYILEATTKISICGYKHHNDQIMCNCKDDDPDKPNFLSYFDL